MSRLEIAFAVTLNDRLAFQGGKAHLYSTYKQAEYGKVAVQKEVGAKMRRWVRIKEVNVDKLASILVR